MIQDMINSETIWIQLNRQTQTYSRNSQVMMCGSGWVNNLASSRSWKRSNKNYVAN